MLKSELEKAAREFCIYQREIPNQIDCFEAGAKWALEWVKLNAYVVGNRFNLEIEEDETETKEK